MIYPTPQEVADFLAIGNQPFNDAYFNFNMLHIINNIPEQREAAKWLDNTIAQVNNPYIHMPVQERAAKLRILRFMRNIFSTPAA
jgi:hypothetical protein